MSQGTLAEDTCCLDSGGAHTLLPLRAVEEKRISADPKSLKSLMEDFLEETPRSGGDASVCCKDQLDILEAQLGLRWALELLLWSPSPSYMLGWEELGS